jgi:hypothetical protein
MTIENPSSGIVPSFLEAQSGDYRSLQATTLRQHLQLDSTSLFHTPKREEQ